MGEEGGQLWVRSGEQLTHCGHKLSRIARLVNGAVYRDSGALDRSLAVTLEEYDISLL